MLNAQQIDALGKLGVRWYLSPDGLIEIPNAAAIPWPANEPPEGLGIGAVISVLALIGSGVLLRAR